jgi:sugar phosphate isomerase/epimerase
MNGSRALMYILALLGVTMMLGGACSSKAKPKPKPKPQPESQSQATARKPVLACETYSLRDYFGRKELDYLTAPKFFKEELHMNGITYNDIWMQSWDNVYLDQIKQACKDANIKITGLICEGNLATTDDKAWEDQIKTDEMKMRAAHYLGAPVVRLNIGGLGDEKLDQTVGVRRCIAAFKRLIPLAKELNVKMTIENHGGVSKHADQILEIIKGTDPEWVGSCLDLGNWPPEERNAECAKLAPYAYHVHAKCNEFRPDGEDTNKDYKYLMGLLQKANYTYAVSIEFEGSCDQKEGVEKTRDLILKYWPELAK